MESSLDRLNKIKNAISFQKWYASRGGGYDMLISDIKEVVALAKANQQQPSIDAMRFEAAKAAMQGMLSNSDIDLDAIYNGYIDYVKVCISIADALIAKLQKPKP